MWLKVMCHPEFVRLLDDSFIELLNKQMVRRGEDRRKRKERKRKGKRGNNFDTKTSML